ncbi:hypothetical protein J2Z70_001109 [Paenibacillus silagei]|uniref:Uncharacterized protein n=1 Tax=Paenibacillus silagei TaxID=1670801 RepID=A0ABS4NLN0_9BACL|nr:hypothetical protein [Paenibacillus silagei]
MRSVGGGSKGFIPLVTDGRCMQICYLCQTLLTNCSNQHGAQQQFNGSVTNYSLICFRYHSLNTVNVKCYSSTPRHSPAPRTYYPHSPSAEFRGTNAPHSFPLPASAEFRGTNAPHSLPLPASAEFRGINAPHSFPLPASAEFRGTNAPHSFPLPASAEFRGINAPHSLPLPASAEFRGTNAPPIP